MAIYGVRSVDADVVNLWENLDGMGGDMVTAQVCIARDCLRIVTLYGPDEFDATKFLAEKMRLFFN